MSRVEWEGGVGGIEAVAAPPSPQHARALVGRCEFLCEMGELTFAPKYFVWSSPAFAYGYMAQASDLVAAVACFSGAMTLSSELGVFPLSELSSDYTPRPVMVIHGTADAVLPYEPATFDYANASYPILPGAEANLALWGSYNGCPEEAATQTTLDNYTLHEINCNSVVSALVEMPGVGHWPFLDGKLSLVYDEIGPVATFDTTQLAWDFFKAASINNCPAGCVSVNARQRRYLLFGSFSPQCPVGCVPA